MTILLVHFTATCFMTGVIWIIQVVHYPLFEKVGAEGYSEYQRSHMTRITWVVLPAMALELITGVLLLFPKLLGSLRISNIEQEVSLSSGLLCVNFLGLGLIWVCTALLLVPQHAKLTNGFEKSEYHKLVRWNWIRTIIWSLRIFLLFYLVMSS